MKNYEATLVAHYAKTVSIHADSPEQAAEKLKIILFDTDLGSFPKGILSAAKPRLTTLWRTQGKKANPRERILRTIVVRAVRASERCVKDAVTRAGIKDTSYQALNLVIHLPMETKFAC